MFPPALPPLSWAELCLLWAGQHPGSWCLPFAPALLELTVWPVWVFWLTSGPPSLLPSSISELCWAALSCMAVSAVSVILLACCQYPLIFSLLSSMWSCCILFQILLLLQLSTFCTACPGSRLISCCMCPRCTPCLPRAFFMSIKLVFFIKYNFPECFPSWEGTLWGSVLCVVSGTCLRLHLQGPP